jgi:uncharacterized membrane protein
MAADTRIAPSRTLAAAAYVLLWITGLVVLLAAKRDDKEARWHAIQAIGLGVAYVAIAAILGLAGRLLAFGGQGFFPVLGGTGLVGDLLAVAVVVLIVVLAVRAYRGERVRLPFIADIADTYA